MRTASIVIVALLVCFGVLYFSVFEGDSGLPDRRSADADAKTAPRFVVEFQRGQLRLSGHAASPEHRQQLIETATQDFPAANRSIELETLEAVPDHWKETTLRLLDALAATRSSSAALGAGELRVRGIAAANWSERLSLLRATLPDAFALLVDVIETDDTISVAELCARATRAHEAGPIKFEESKTVLRRSALPELERVAALADMCRDSVIRITGHSDSSGDESSNQRLSLARAQAVADILVQMGIAADRIRPAGAGSSMPLADNQSRYGRSINRRIEITFLAEDAATPGHERLFGSSEINQLDLE